MTELVTPHWINRLVRRDQRAIKIVVLSDSQADGFSGGDANGIPDFRLNWPNVLAEDLARKFGLSASHWIPCDVPTGEGAHYEYSTPSWDSGATWSDRTGDSNGIGGATWLKNSSPSDQTKSLTWALNADVTSVDVVLGGYPEWGTGAVTITDGYSATTVVTPTVHAQMFRIDNPGPSVKVSNAVSGVHVMGVVEHYGSEDSGVHVYNLGFAGKQAEFFANHTDPMVGHELGALLELIAPDLVIVALGGNDAEGGRTAAELETSLVDLATNVHTSTPDAEFLFVAMDYDYSGMPGVDWDDYSAAIAAAAAAANSLVADTQYTTPIAGEGLFVIDGVHFTIAGARSVSDAINPILWPR